MKISNGRIHRIEARFMACLKQLEEAGEEDFMPDWLTSIRDLLVAVKERDEKAMILCDEAGTEGLDCPPRMSDLDCAHDSCSACWKEWWNQ